ncbi:GUN4-like [Ostreococcus tauri]|uniref:GUN4-like n=1 Tax=Ostreococcus tauri TaxID=70448 RepID=A0A096P8X0_OSTTA|nr:GUN4-like [Ostreococcus tauri]CEG00484.1 GUN4-like [Ostreococcus tauri]|eukprot:XP_022840402.1 GUN4-like [Ostreococcus tauri]
MSVSLRVPAAVARASPRSARARVGRRRSSHPARSSATSGTSSTATTEDGKPAPPELASEIGVDYEPFRALLEAGEWEKADDEHRRLMCVLAGEEAEDREWVYFTEVDNMPVTDLRTIDALWKYYSNGRFGFSVQRKIWIGQKRQWAKFFKKIDWTTGENGDYRKFPQEFQWRADAAQGHMPLTNALRGTQLLAALLEHPAFGPGLPERTSEGSFYEGTASRETPVRFEMPTVGGVLDVAVRFGKFGVLFAQELMK